MLRRHMLMSKLSDQSCKSVTADVLSVYLYRARSLVCESQGYDRSEISALS